MDIYRVIDKVDNPENMDAIGEILDRWYFQTSIMSKEVKDGVKEAAIELANLGEKRIYKFIKDAYGLKI